MNYEDLEQTSLDGLSDTKLRKIRRSLERELDTWHRRRAEEVPIPVDQMSAEELHDRALSIRYLVLGLLVAPLVAFGSCAYAVQNDPGAGWSLPDAVGYFGVVVVLVGVPSLIHKHDQHRERLPKVESAIEPPPHSMSDLSRWRSIVKKEQRRREKAKAKSQTRGPRPSQRTIATPHDAEVAAADWLRWMGFRDVVVSPIGPDAGIDVRAREVVCQVKAQTVPAGRPVIQQLYGVGQAEQKRAVFFSLGGYTDAAREFANKVDIPLFRFDYAGEPSPENNAATKLIS